MQDSNALPAAPAPSRLSWRNVVVLLFPCALIVLAVAAYYYYTTQPTNEPGDLLKFISRGMEAPTKLDAQFSDADDDLVADPPKDAKELLDPEALVFSVLGSDEEGEKERWKDFVEHLARETGKKVEVSASEGAAL